MIIQSCSTDTGNVYEFDPLTYSIDVEAFGGPYFNLEFTQNASLEQDSGDALPDYSHELVLKNLSGLPLDSTTFQLSVFNSDQTILENLSFRKTFSLALNGLGAGESKPFEDFSWDQTNWESQEVQVQVIYLDSIGDVGLAGQYIGDFILKDSNLVEQNLGPVRATVNLENQLELLLGGDQNEKRISGIVRNDQSFAGAVYDADGNSLYPVLGDSGVFSLSSTNPIEIQLSSPVLDGNTQPISIFHFFLSKTI